MLHQAREEAPYLKKFANDWATQALAMQLMKNKRAHAYRRGYLEVPERYAYLKETSAKRYEGRSRATTSPLSECEGTGDTAASCEPTLEPTVIASGSKRKAQAPTELPRKKQKVATRAMSSKAKGKRKASAVEREHNDEMQEDEVVGEE